MDKLVTLCWQCQDLFKLYYQVDRQTNAKPDKKCESCGKQGEVALDLFRIRTKIKEDA